MKQQKPKKAPRRRTGRPSRLEEEVTITVEGRKQKVRLADRILSVVRGGVPPLTAALACGVSRTTWYRWQQEARQGSKKFRDFWDDFEGARAEGHAILVGRIQQAAARDWRAALAILERTDPENWSPTVKVEQKVQEELDGALDKVKAVLSDEDFQRVLAALAHGAGGEEETSGPPIQ